MTSTTSEKFFEEKYRAQNDPWNFAGSPYELARYEAIVRAISGHQYDLAFEPGCSVGVLTEKLAQHCARVEACDISATAVERAKDRCGNLNNVVISHSAIQDQLPSGADLYVLSEVGYYMTSEDFRRLLEANIASLAPAATIVGCHWLGYSADHILSGDEVHRVIDAVPGLVKNFSERHENFILDRWVKQEKQK